MSDAYRIFLIIIMVGLLMISFTICIKAFITEMKKSSNEQFFLFSLLGIIIVFLIPFILALVQTL